MPNESKDNHNNHNSLDPKTSRHLIGGFVGGLTAAVVLQPLDLIKTRIQQQPKNTTNITNKSIFHQVIHIARTNPLQLWRGTLPSTIRTSIGSGLYLSVLNTMRTTVATYRYPSVNKIQRNKSSELPKLSMRDNLLTGAVARGIVGYITMPVTVIKVRYESTLYNYTSLTHAVTEVYKSEGIRGFFKGFGATCLRDVPYAGLYVLLYEKSKSLIPMFLPRAMVRYQDDSDGSGGGEKMFSTGTATLVNTVGAFMSAGVATTLTAPFDTVKTRMQLEPQKFRNFVMSFGILVRNEGFSSLLSGLSMRLTRKAFSAGIAWGIYEELIKRFM